MATARNPRSTRRHETTKALLRAHLSAAARYGHSTRHCAVCHRLRRLVAERPPEPFEPTETASPAGMVISSTTSSTTTSSAPTPAVRFTLASEPVAPPVTAASTDPAEESTQLAARPSTDAAGPSAVRPSAPSPKERVARPSPPLAAPSPAGPRDSACAPHRAP